MNVQILDKNGKKKEELTLDEGVFGVVPNKPLLAQYLRVFLANQRQGTSSTKTRAEVSGGGKKPWKQKGTGRARAGSIRSPLWRHGGITHGPHPKSWTLSLSKSLKRAAIISALSTKYDNITVLDSFDTKTPKTKDMLDLLDKLNLKHGKTLIVLDSNDMDVRKGVSNIKRVSTALVSNLNAHELLGAKNVLFVKEAILKINDKYKPL